MPATPTQGIRKIIMASSLGTILEWYDLYIFGSLAPVIAATFFPKTHPAAALLYTIATFATGLLVRPFGALLFGRLGDRIGRKPIFLLTLLIMGGATFAIGLVPKYETIGLAAPLIVLLLRLLQGLAVGGEYGGAVTYVAEYSPPGRRGYFTSWIQMTATAGLLVALGVILLLHHFLDPDPAISLEKFNSWGWRIPFLISGIVVIVSVYIRSKMAESPLFQRLRTAGKTSAHPLKESFGQKANLKLVLPALFGAVMGQGVILYTGQFYAQSFLENTCHIDPDQSKVILMVAMVLATPFFLLFGSWSDKIGRKWIMLAGMALAVASYPYLFRQLLNIAQTTGSSRTLLPDQKEIRTSVAFIGETGNLLRSAATILHYDDGMTVTTTEKDTVFAGGKTGSKLKEGYTEKPGTADCWKMIFIFFVMILYVAMTHGPIAAFLAELFPTRIRYTSISLPYHIGNGLFGGLVPFMAVLFTTANTGNKLAGLWYPAIITGVCLITGALCIPQGRQKSFSGEYEEISA